MNLQTDNMKRILLFFSLMLLLGNIKGLAQSIVIDPAMIGTLVYSHQEQQGVLKDIQSEETKICSCEKWKGYYLCFNLS